jgi:hypothetical protein
MLEQVLTSKVDHSPAIDELVGRLKEIGFTGTSAPPSPPQGQSSDTTPAVDQYANSWVAMLGSYPQNTTSESDLDVVIERLEQKIGGEIHKIRSDDYSSLTPGYWVLFHAGGFHDGHEALDFCAASGITDEGSCVGRYLSGTAADRDLSCRFSDSPDAPHCVKR